ncbi:MAG: PIN domain-containing protein [Candidatus Binataceae bacterium]
MFANRFTAIIDACTLVDTLKRNLLLTLAEAGFFRLRWSGPILDETEAAIDGILRKKGRADAADRAKRARASMEAAFEDAMVTDFDIFLPAAAGLPDPDDAHVVAAAIKTQAAMIVTENLKDFPAAILDTLDIEAKSADEFIADTIALDEGRAVAAIRRMRERFEKPEMTAEALLLSMEATGLVEAVNLLRPHVESL